MDKEVIKLIIQKARDGVLSQGGPSTNLEGGCLYRGINGTKCGIGWLIPDDKYDKTFDEGNSSVSDLLLGKPDRGAKFKEALAASGVTDPLNYIDLMIRVQLAHDGASRGSINDFIASFTESMDEITKEYLP